MIVLLDRDVIVPDGSVCLGVHMIPVSVPIMTQVVTDAGDKERQYVDLAQLKDIYQAAICEEKVPHLGHINPMQIVVVRDILPVSPINFVEEPCQLWLFNIIQDIVLKEQMKRYQGQSLLSADFRCKGEDVKFPRVARSLKKIFGPFIIMIEHSDA